MMIDLTPILEAVLMLAVALITAFVIPYIKKKVGAENMDEFLAWVDIAVAAAEQLFDSADGNKKKMYVVKFLESKGFKVDTEDLDNAIEAAVLHLHDQLYSPDILEIAQEVEADVADDGQDDAEPEGAKA